MNTIEADIKRGPKRQTEEGKDDKDNALLAKTNQNIQR